MDDCYQDLAKLVSPEQELCTLFQIGDAHRGITLDDLRKAAAPIRPEHINIAIAQHALYVDLSTYRLTEPEHPPLFLTRKAALAHRSSNQRADDLGIEAHPVVIEQGSQILWDGKRWMIAEGQTELTLC